MPSGDIAVAPFFIVGSGRSGSTLLRVILSAHSRLCIPPETYFLLPLLRELPPRTLLDEQQLERAVELVVGHRRWPDMQLDETWFRDRARALHAPTVTAVMGLIYDEHLRREGKQRWGDKTPPYVRILGELADIYPDARFIHLLRDGRDVAKSFQGTGWYGPWLHHNTVEWRDAVRSAIAFRDGPLGDRLLDVRYEDLVLDTDRTVHRICDFLGERFEPRMLEWADTVEGKIPERESAFHKKVMRRPEPTDVYRWRRELSSRELAVAEAFLGDELGAAGYDPRFAGPLWTLLRPLIRPACRLIVAVRSFQLRAFRFLRKRLGERSA